MTKSDLSYASDSFKAMVDRQQRAHADFIGMLQSFGELSRTEAQTILGYFLNKKMVKTDYAIGVIRVKHGRYFDRDFLQALADKLAN